MLIFKRMLASNTFALVIEQDALRPEHAVQRDREGTERKKRKEDRRRAAGFTLRGPRELK